MRRGARSAGAARSGGRRLLFVAGAALLAAFPEPSLAQAMPEPGITLVGGAMDFDSAAGETGGVVGLRFDSPLVPLGWHWTIEPSFAVGWFRPDGVRARYLIVPEMQLQWQPLTGALRPYAGIGGGFAFVASSDSTERTTDLTGTLAAGVRARMGAVGLQLEVRRRTVDVFDGWTTEWTLGLSRRSE